MVYVRAAVILLFHFCDSGWPIAGRHAASKGNFGTQPRLHDPLAGAGSRCVTRHNSQGLAQDGYDRGDCERPTWKESPD